MTTLLDNLRLALRDLRHRPVFTATVVLTLAVGIGATTAAFALVDAVFLTRLPVGDQGRLVAIWGAPPARYSGLQLPWPLPWDTQQLALERDRAFAALASYRVSEPYAFAGRYEGRTVHVAKTSVSGNFFDVLGVRASLGRLLRAEDDRPGGPDVVVLSDRVWRTDFGADSHVIGRLVFFAGAWRRVIGIAPPEFAYPVGTSAWVPVVQESQARWDRSPNTFAFYMVGRLRPGVTPRMARSEVEAVLRVYSPSPQYRDMWGDPPTVGIVEPFADVVLGTEVRPGVTVLFAAVTLVLMIACTNIAGLLTARGISRTGELAVRSALGASHTQLVAHLLAESVVLGLAGGVLGLGAALALVHAAVALAPPGLPMIESAHVDLRVLAFAGTVTAASVIAFGLAPAVRGARAASHQVLRAASRSVTAGRMTELSRQALVAAQVALALVVLSGAGLLGRTLAHWQQITLGFEPDHLLFFRLDVMLPASPARDTSAAWASRAEAMDDRLSERLPATPALGPMTTTLALPFSGTAGKTYYALDGQQPPAGGTFELTDIDYALADYFKVMSIPLLRGRTLTRRDNDARGAPVIVVNELLAQRAWPGRDPLGHQMRFRDDTTRQWYTVVGVVGNARYDDLVTPPRPTVYLSPRQANSGDPWFVVRTRGDPARSVALLEDAIEKTDPAFSISRSAVGPQLLSARLARPRALTALFGALATTGLLLSAIGLFGVLSAYVRDRRREIAVRSALGATPAQLRSLVLAQTLGVAVAGLACGIPLALGGSHVLRGMVSDVRPLDALTVVAVIVVLLAAVALATYGPMVRASRVDARTALAAE